MLLEVSGLTKEYDAGGGPFSRGAGTVRAVDGVSFRIAAGETLGLVGESGCGKTTLGKSILRLIEPSAGSIVFAGVPLLGLSGEALRRARRRMQIVFQDPISSLDPRMTVGGTVGEPLRVHGLARGAEADEAAAGLLRRVGLPPAAINRYPHEFSGGQRQRIGIARAIALGPELLVCDEPVSALDVSIQAQIINLLEDLQDEAGIAYLFISHDLRVVEHISDRVAVMYLGAFVEEAGRDELYRNPLHPYTRMLISAAPGIGRAAGAPGGAVRGEPPSPAAPPPGCRFHPRCPLRMPPCHRERPVFAEPEPGHRVACWRYS
jgi:oligopeptide/dipeptide ABC transporter ATP-binding protein